jgi:hypothetical protein
MSRPQKVRVTRERHFAPHTLLLSAANLAFKRGEDTEAAEGGVGYWWAWLETLLFCSLSIEAIANSYGHAFVRDWEDFETTSPVAKIRLIAERCGLNPNFSQAPWGIVKRLVAFRNRIAHAKPEYINDTLVCDQDKYHLHIYAKPESKLEKMITKEFARTSLDQIYELLRLLSTGLPTDMVIRLETESWSGGAKALGILDAP